MVALTKYEKEVLEIMLQSAFGESDIQSLISSGELINIDYTGGGYFLEIFHIILPRERQVINRPTLIGKTNNIEVGFVLFIENKTLTIECYNYGDYFPEDFRFREVNIELYNSQR